MWEACLPLRSMFWGMWAFPGRSETCNPGTVRRQFCQRGQFADFHSSPLEKERRKPSLKANSLRMVRIMTWETTNTFPSPPAPGVFYIQSGGCIINHPNWDTCESKRGGAINNDSRTTGINWDCPWQTKTYGSLYL